MTFSSRPPALAEPSPDRSAVDVLPLGDGTFPLVDGAPAVADPPTRDASLAGWYVLAVLLAVMLLANIDRQILVLLAEPLRLDLGLTDVKLGLLQGVGFALVIGLAALPLAWLADRFGRRKVLVSCVLMWSGATVGCGLARDFSELLMATMLLGFGEAALVPIAFGVLPEMFRNRKRVLANAIFMTGNNLGGAAGITICGLLVANVGALRPWLPAALAELTPWRLAFFAAALPGPLVALLAATMRTPRGPVAPRLAPAVADLHEFSRYVHERAHTLGAFFGGFGLAQLGLTAMLAWLPVIAARLYGQSPQEIGAGMGAAVIAGIVLGVFLGTLTVRHFSVRLGAVTAMRVSWVSFVLAGATALPMLLATHAWQLYVLFGLQAAMVMAAANLLPTVLQDLSPPDMRSRIAALYTVVTVLLTATGPVAVGLVSDRLSDRPAGLLIAVVVIGAGTLGLGAMLVQRGEGGFVALAAVLRSGALPAYGATAPRPS